MAPKANSAWRIIARAYNAGYFDGAYKDKRVIRKRVRQLIGHSTCVAFSLTEEGDDRLVQRGGLMSVAFGTLYVFLLPCEKCAKL